MKQSVKYEQKAIFAELSCGFSDWHTGMREKTDILSRLYIESRIAGFCCYFVIRLKGSR
jgi:hypothetical protein